MSTKERRRVPLPDGWRNWSREEARSWARNYPASQGWGLATTLRGRTKDGCLLFDAEILAEDPPVAGQPTSSPRTELRDVVVPAPATWWEWTPSERETYLSEFPSQQGWLPGSKCWHIDDQRRLHFRAIVRVEDAPDEPPTQQTGRTQESERTTDERVTLAPLEMPGYPGVPLLVPTHDPYSPAPSFVKKWGTRFAARGTCQVVLTFEGDLTTCEAFWDMAGDWSARWHADFAEPDGQFLVVVVPEEMVDGFLVERAADVRAVRHARSLANLTTDPEARRRGGRAARRKQMERTACLTALGKPAQRKNQYGKAEENPAHIDLLDLLEAMAAGERVYLPEHRLEYLEPGKTCREVPLRDALRAALGPRTKGENQGAIGDLAYRAFVRLIRGTKAQAKPLLLRDCLSERRLRLLREVLAPRNPWRSEHWPFDVKPDEESGSRCLAWGTGYTNPKTDRQRMDPLTTGWPKLAEIKGDDIRAGKTARRYAPRAWLADLDAHSAAWWVARLDGRDGDKALGWDVSMLAAVLAQLDGWKAGTPALLARRTGYPKLAQPNHSLYRALFAAGILVLGYQATVAEGEPDTASARFSADTPLRLHHVRRNDPVIRALRLALGRYWDKTFPLGEPTLQQGEAAFWHNVLTLDRVTRWEDAGTCIAMPPDAARNNRWIRWNDYGNGTPKGIPDALLVTRIAEPVALEVTKSARRDISAKVADYDGPALLELGGKYPTVVFAAASSTELQRVRSSVTEASVPTQDPRRYAVADVASIDALTLSVEAPTANRRKFDNRTHEIVEVVDKWVVRDLVAADDPTAPVPGWLVEHVGVNLALHVRWREALRASRKADRTDDERK